MLENDALLYSIPMAQETSPAAEIEALSLESQVDALKTQLAQYKEW